MGVVKFLTGSRADGAHKVGDDGERADAHAAKGSRCGNVAVELLLQGLSGVAVTLPTPNASLR